MIGEDPSNALKSIILKLRGLSSLNVFGMKRSNRLPTVYETHGLIMDWP